MPGGLLQIDGGCCESEEEAREGCRQLAERMSSEWLQETNMRCIDQIEFNQPNLDLSSKGVA